MQTCAVQCLRGKNESDRKSSCDVVVYIINFVLSKQVIAVGVDFKKQNIHAEESENAYQQTQL